MSLKRNLAANYVGQVWVALMGLAFVPLYIRYLGTESLGVIGVFTLLQSWLMLLDLGITPTLNREMARFTAGGHSTQSIANLLRSLEVVGGGMAIGIVIVLWAASGYLARHWLQVGSLPIDVVREALAVMGLVIALRFIEGIYRGGLLGLQRQVFYNAVTVVVATARFAGAAVVVAFISPTLRAFYFWQAGVSVVAVATLAVAVHRTLPPAASRARVSRDALRDVQRFAGGMVAITCLTLLVSQVDKLLLSRLVPLEEFGYYTLAATIAGVLSMMVSPILQTIYPRLVQEATSGDRARLADTYHQGAQLVTATTAPAMLLLVVFPQGVLYAWSGDARLAAATAPLLLPLALGSFFNALMGIPYQSQLAHGWTGLTVRVNAVAVLLIVPALLWTVPRQGAPAAAWLWLTLNLSYVLIAIQFMHRRILIGEKIRWYLEDVAVPVGGATIIALLMTLIAPAATANRSLWVAFLALVGVVTLVTTLWLAGSLRQRLVTSLRELAR